MFVANCSPLSSHPHLLRNRMSKSFVVGAVTHRFALIDPYLCSFLSRFNRISGTDNSLYIIDSPTFSTQLRRFRLLSLLLSQHGWFLSVISLFIPSCVCIISCGLLIVSSALQNLPALQSLQITNLRTHPSHGLSNRFKPYFASLSIFLCSI